MADAAPKIETKPEPTIENPFDGKTPDGAPAAKKPEAPERVKVKVGEEEFETDAASAAAINALNASNAQMADFIRKGFKTPDAPAPVKKAEEYDYETQLFVNPKEAIARMKAEMRADIMGEVTAAYTNAETKKDFWSGFYSTNTDLAGEKMIVDAVTARDWNKLKDLPMADAGKKIAEAAKKELMRLSGGTSKSDPDARPIEGSGNNKKPAPRDQNDDEDKVLSLSDVIRKRKEARTKASTLQISKE